MHYNRLNLQVNPNNQVVLTFGNYRHAREIYKSISCIEAGYGKKERLRLNAAIVREKRRKEPKYKWVKGQFVRVVPKAIAPLAIIKKSQQPPRCCKLNKPKSFTQASGQKLRECGSAIDHICKFPERSTAVTLTLPADTEAAFTALAAYSGYAINRLFQYVRREYGESILWFFVWEYQKRGAPHLHIALFHPDSGVSLECGQKMKKIWFGILQDIGDRAATCMFTSRRKDRCYLPEHHHFYCEPARRSLGAYFSKYAGKQESKQSWYCQKYPVSRFWGSCYPLKRLVAELSLDYSLVVDDTEHIQFLVQEILGKIAKFDMNLQTSYDFDISKTYQSGHKLGLAEGTRMVFYCHPKQYKEVLRAFDDIIDSF